MATVDNQVDSGIPRGAELVAFSEAVLGDDDRALEESRAALLSAVGPAGFVDAAATVAAFQQMDRIADSTGIPLDRPIVGATDDFRERLGLEQFGSAENSSQLLS